MITTEKISAVLCYSATLDLVLSNVSDIIDSSDEKLIQCIFGCDKREVYYISRATRVEMYLDYFESLSDLIESHFDKSIKPEFYKAINEKDFLDIVNLKVLVKPTVLKGYLTCLLEGDFYDA